MALSLDSIYQPFNQFFSQKFAAGDGGPVQFRFAHLPRSFSDSDFLFPAQPQLGPQASLATEVFSAAVDGVTRLDADDRTVWMSPSSRISDLYHDEILGPAIAFLALAGTDDTAKQTLIDNFNQVKADSLGIWEKAKSASFDGVSWFRPSGATPGSWWDRNAPGVWTPQSFLVKGAATTPGPTQPRPDPVLRLRPQEAVFRPMLEAQIAAVAPSPAPAPAPAPRVAFAARSLAAVARPAPIAVARPAVRMSPATLAMVRPMVVAAAQPAPTLPLGPRKDLGSQFQRLPFRQRLEVQEVLANASTTKPVVVSDATISFSYCVVSVARPWMDMAFLNNAAWCIPGQAKAALSANDGHGVPALPVGFVAIKDLSIKAPWTPEDVTNLELSEQFGPFLFDSQIVNGAIGHEGIQIVGWMLQNVPPLPPCA